MKPFGEKRECGLEGRLLQWLLDRYMVRKIRACPQPFQGEQALELDKMLTCASEICVDIARTGGGCHV
jgi:hypothetical protein